MSKYFYYALQTIIIINLYNILINNLVVDIGIPNYSSSI